MKPAMISILLVMIASLCLAATATVNWQASTDPKVYGYKVYFDNHSTPPYGRHLDVGNVTSHRFENLSTQKLYCFAVTQYAYTSSHQTGYVESGYSNHQCGTIAIHDDYRGRPNYRASGADNPAPDNFPNNPLPDCGQCHSGGTP